MSNELGKRIRAARERRHWTQTELADQVGVKLRTIGGWERGETVPQNRMTVLEDVLGHEIYGTAPQISRVEGVPPEVSVLVSHWDDLTQMDIARVLKLLADELPRRARG